MIRQLMKQTKNPFTIVKKKPKYLAVPKKYFIFGTKFKHYRTIDMKTDDNFVLGYEGKTLEGFWNRCITSVDIPSSVTEVEWHSFEGCTSLVSVVIPSSVTKIGSYALSGCKSLISLVIPSSVSKIGKNAFNGCSSLTEIHFRHTNPLDFSECFEEIDVSKITLYVPTGSEFDYLHHPFYSKFKKVVTEE